MHCQRTVADVGPTPDFGPFSGETSKLGLPRRRPWTAHRLMPVSPAACVHAPITATSSLGRSGPATPAPTGQMRSQRREMSISFRGGHTVEYEEESEILELNPAAALQTVMNHFEKVLAQGWGQL